jgi:protein-tyrosine phosphatase
MSQTVLKRLEALQFPNLLNARDLGGHSTTDGGRTRWRAFLRTDDLCHLTPEGERALREYGVRTVVDLRWPEEVHNRPSVFRTQPGDVAYHHISMLLETEAVWRSSTPMGPKETWNRVVLDHAGREIVQVLALMARAAPGVVLFHCAAGKDRTGLIAILLLAIADVGADSIAEDYAQSTLCLRDAYLEARPEEDRSVILEDVRCPPEHVHVTLEHLEAAHGGLHAYLTRMGLTPGDLTGLRARLRG